MGCCNGECCHLLIDTKRNPGNGVPLFLICVGAQCQSTQANPLRYDKGEHRIKHCDREEEAEIVWEKNLAVGKCPRGFTLELATSLLLTAIPEYRKTDPARPSSYWCYHDGVIYKGRSSDGGRTWHASPHAHTLAEIPRTILRELQKQAKDDIRFKKWLKKEWPKT